MEIHIIKPIFVLFGVSALIIYLLNRFRLSSVVGFLLSGVVVGPSGLGLVGNTKDVELLSEIGVTLLMFTLGLEFSVTKLFMLKREVLKGGALQIFTTVTLFFVLGFLVMSSPWKVSLFYGLLFSLSSTAIIFKYLLEKGEIDASHGRLSIGILLFQDLCVVPFMLLIPFLAGEKTALWDVLLTFLRAAFVVLFVVFSAKWFVPFLLKEVVKTKNRELFLLVIILIWTGTTLFTASFGLSLSLGAFLAGIMISESEYASQAISDILPLKESFSGLFFISIGMLLNAKFLSQHALTVIFLVFSIVFLKIFAGTLSSFLIGYPLRPSIQTGIFLFQVGEFSFILAMAGKAKGLIGEEFYHLFIGTSVITMILTPLFLSVSYPFSLWLSRKLKIKEIRRVKLEEKSFTRKKDHVIIVGFGTNGRNLARVLKKANIPYIILDMNPDKVKHMKKMGEPIYYGDATSPEVMKRMGISHARVLVVAISDPPSTRRIVQISRQENPKVFLIVRTRYVEEVEGLLKIGADEVVPEEFETSIEIFARVLGRYNIPRNVVSEYIDAIRKDSYMALRTYEWQKKFLVEADEFLRQIEVEAYFIKEDSLIDGHSIRELKIRAKTGATIIAIKRGEKIYDNPSPEFQLRKGDTIWFIGKGEEIVRAFEYLDSGSFILEQY